MPATFDPHPFATASDMTSWGRFRDRADGVPPTDDARAAVLQGLVVHEHMAEAYGVRLTDEARSAVHLRPAEAIIAAALELDDRPLTDARPPARRVAGNCRQFSVLCTGLLQAQGVPARARCGFGAYFVPDAFEDHWVCERWDGDLGRWRLIDAQIDAGQRDFFSIDFDLTDVPRDQFLVGAEAWRRCRSGLADPDRFGLSLLPEFGLWWVAANLMRDAASLVGVPVLPWDCWGEMPTPDDPITDELAALFDDLAAATLDPDATSADLDRLLHDDRIAVPTHVRNVTRGTLDPL